MTTITFNKEIFAKEINEYIDEYKLVLISFTENEIRCFQILKDTINIRMFDEVKIENELTCDMIDFDNMLYFLNYGILICDEYFPFKPTLNFLFHINMFDYVIRYYEDEDDYLSLFVIYF